MAAVHSSRGCAFGDFDNDGDVDVVIVNLNEPPSLLRNDVTGGGHWLKVKLVGTKSNRDGFGARVEVRAGSLKQRAEVRANSSFESASDPRLHFGLDATTRIDSITVRWPSGRVDNLGPQAVDQELVIEEGTGVASRRRQ